MERAKKALVRKGPAVLSQLEAVAAKDGQIGWAWIQQAARYVYVQTPVVLASTWAWLVGAEHGVEDWYASKEVQQAIANSKEGLSSAYTGTVHAAAATASAVGEMEHDAVAAAQAAYESPEAVAFREELKRREEALEAKAKEEALKVAAEARAAVEHEVDELTSRR